MRRILPITLVAFLMVLPLKIDALINGFPVVAQQFDREFGNHERPWAQDLQAESAESPPKESSAPAQQPGVPAVPTTISLSAPSCEDPLLRGAIEEQKVDGQARARRLADAEAVLAATEARASVQIQRLTEIKQEVQALMKQRSDLEQEDLRRMVAIYEAMKPRDAARIFNDLDTDIVIDVLDRMIERRSAPIIAGLEDRKAREVTRIILQRRALPGDRAATASRNTLTN